MTSKIIEAESLQHIQINAFAYELLREEVLPDLMGKELPRILYWAGKNIARNHPLKSMDQVSEFFIQAGWGELTILEQNRHAMMLQLTSPLIKERYRTRTRQANTTYQLEAGFIAQQIQQMQGIVTEAYEEQKKRADSVHFIVKWDHKDKIE
ncbi:YslB family protein [Bacillus sp. 165]|uniref:DUF2507 domain-containing protein n=1 Tax=Bacillus sp. 165 TaxID=1529117 RepID=UPI001ADC3A80|nr:YslB family protein [Bacillus sp. 165]